MSVGIGALLYCNIPAFGVIYNVRRSAPGGGTLIEVLAGLLVSAIFVSVIMQAIVTAAAFRAKAAQYDEAISWVQEDLETVLEQAKQYEMTAYPYSPLCDATVASSGFAAWFINDSAAGLGGTTQTLGPRSIGGKSFTLTRTADYQSSPDPFRLLQLTYTVTPQSGGGAIATVNTEVMPQAVLKCQSPAA